MFSIRIERHLSTPFSKKCGKEGIERIGSPTVRKLIFGSLTLCIFSAYAFLFLLAVWGLFSVHLPKGTGACAALLTAVVLYFWILHSLVFAHERYHLPLVPILLLFAANFFTECFGKDSSGEGDFAKKGGSGPFQRLRDRPVCAVCAMLLSGIFLVFWGCECVWFLG